MSLGQYSAYWAKMRADCPALVFKGETLDWADVERRAQAMAAALQAFGVQKSDRVGCLLPNCPEWVITYIATFKVGGILVPLNMRYGDGELQEIERQIECTVVVSDPALIRKLEPTLAECGEQGKQVHLYGRRMSEAKVLPIQDVFATGGVPTPVRVEPQDVAIISFTSGSTGLPKGVMLTHEAVEALAQSQILAFRWTSEERVLLLAPFAFTGGVITVLTPTHVVGACLYIEENLDPQGALDLLVRERITSLTAVPIFFERIAACAGYQDADLSHLHSAVTGGAPVAESLLQLYLAKGVFIRHTYGCTEGSGMLAAPTEADAIARPSSCGWPLATVEIRLVNETGGACEVSEPGEILIRGIQVMKGYWRNPQADREAWIDGWYRTGDVGIFDEAGRLKIVDRKKNMIITGGVNVYPAEVERAMSAMAGVVEVLVFGRPDASWGERIAAVVFGPQPDQVQTLLDESRRVLGAYKAPREIIVSPRPLPRTTTGKLARAEIDRLYDSLVAAIDPAGQSLS